MATTMMPMPPNHCSIPRHRFRPTGSVSSRVKTVDPVVVSPDIASKKASTKRASVAPSTKGMAPKIGKTSQTPVVSRNVCWIDRPRLTALAQDSVTKSPIMTVIAAASAKAPQWSLPTARSAASGTHIATPRLRTIRPST